jgi:hypothetical protein
MILVGGLAWGSVVWLVNGPIGFWFGVSVNWWDIGLFCVAQFVDWLVNG